MKKYKKGDWVVFLDYNNYPVQLKQNGQLGLLDRLYSGTLFTPMSRLDGTDLKVYVEYCVKDPRQMIPNGSCYGWFPLDRIRHATKGDLERLEKSYDDQIKSLDNTIKKYKKLIKDLS